MTNEKQYIEITGCSEPEYWYATRIGYKYSVTRTEHDNTAYRVYRPEIDSDNWYVQMSDCKLVPSPQEETPLSGEVDIIGGNVVLAKFDGWYKTQHHGWHHNGEDYWVIDVESFGFHSSYDALLPVWHKFRDMDLREEWAHEGYKDSIAKALISSNSPIEPFRELVKAITWLNSVSPETTVKEK